MFNNPGQYNLTFDVDCDPQVHYQAVTRTSLGEFKLLLWLWASPQLSSIYASKNSENVTAAFQSGLYFHI